MPRNNSVSRRMALKLTGAAASVAVLAGCTGDSDDDDGGDTGDSGIEIEAGETILLEGHTGGWEGAEPSAIAGETNPTLVLEEGEEYEIGWTQGDGSGHNIELRDDGGDVVDGYATDLTDDPGDGDFIEFTASSELAVYRCSPHGAMEGDITVQ